MTEAYLQTSGSPYERELSVTSPDPDDGTLVILLPVEQVVAAGESVGEDGQVWVRVCP